MKRQLIFALLKDKKITCRKCNGTGKLEAGLICAQCNGTGHETILED